MVHCVVMFCGAVGVVRTQPSHASMLFRLCVLLQRIHFKDLVWLGVFMQNLETALSGGLTQMSLVNYSRRLDSIYH